MRPYKILRPYDILSQHFMKYHYQILKKLRHPLQRNESVNIRKL